MKTGLKKSDKTTDIYFDEQSPVITIATHNTGLKNRLTVYARSYPQCCEQVDDDGWGCLTFEIEKGRFCFRLTAPYSDDRREAASSRAKKNSRIIRKIPRVE